MRLLTGRGLEPLLHLVSIATGGPVRALYTIPSCVTLPTQPRHVYFFVHRLHIVAVDDDNGRRIVLAQHPQHSADKRKQHHSGKPV